MYIPSIIDFHKILPPKVAETAKNLIFDIQPAPFYVLLGKLAERYNFWNFYHSTTITWGFGRQIDFFNFYIFDPFFDRFKPKNAIFDPFLSGTRVAQNFFGLSYMLLSGLHEKKN